jgi:hypothetical protein
MKRFRSFLSVGFAALALGLIIWSVADARYGNAVKAASRFFITARLVDEIKNAAKSSATVEVTVKGIRLVDPALASLAPGAIEGHLHYQLDGGPIIATPTPKLSFHELSPGEHKISVNLADDNHMPIGMPVVLTVRVPAVKTVMSY